jgi:thiamine kinase-like enzyme
MTHATIIYQNPLKVNMIIDNTLYKYQEFDGWNSYYKINSGLINDVYVIELKNKQKFVLRLLKNAGFFLIDRISEMKNSQKSYKIGVGPNIIHFDIINNVVISEYIDGKVLSNQDLANKTLIINIISSMKKLHRRGNFNNRFDPFEILLLYKQICKMSKYKTIENYFIRLINTAKILIIKRFLEKNMSELVSCHNDIRAFGNILEQDNRIFFVDYEFSGLNDPCYELGFFWSESGFDLKMLEYIVKKYFNNKDVKLNMIKCYLYSMIADYMWYLQGVVGENVGENKKEWKSYYETTYKNYYRRSSFASLYKLITKKSLNGIVV